MFVGYKPIQLSVFTSSPEQVKPERKDMEAKLVAWVVDGLWLRTLMRANFQQFPIFFLKFPLISNNFKSFLIISNNFWSFPFIDHQQKWDPKHYTVGSASSTQSDTEMLRLSRSHAWAFHRSKQIWAFIAWIRNSKHWHGRQRHCSFLCRFILFRSIPCWTSGM